jgi:hypothetical protein
MVFIDGKMALFIKEVLLMVKGMVKENGIQNKMDKENLTLENINRITKMDLVNTHGQIDQLILEIS